MTTGREQIFACAQALGWTVTESTSEMAIFVKAVPMIEQRDENRLFVAFNGPRVVDAQYGPDRRPHPLVRVGRPRLGDVIDHLCRIGVRR